MDKREEVTIAEYELTAESFQAGTWHHDVSQNRDALTAFMPHNPGKILDVGCGPGRDLVAFKSQGHTVVGLDATPAFVEIAKKLSGCEVLHQSFLNLDLPKAEFDGVFANASLIHVPRDEMVRVLKDLHKALVVNGAIVMSMCRGNWEGYEERPTGKRYTTGWEYHSLAPCLEQAGFAIVNHYYRPPGLPREAQSWIVMVGKKMHITGL